MFQFSAVHDRNQLADSSVLSDVFAFHTDPQTVVYRSVFRVDQLRMVILLCSSTQLLAHFLVLLHSVHTLMSHNSGHNSYIKLCKNHWQLITDNKIWLHARNPAAKLCVCSALRRFGWFSMTAVHSFYNFFFPSFLEILKHLYHSWMSPSCDRFGLKFFLRFLSDLKAKQLDWLLRSQVLKLAGPF